MSELYNVSPSPHIRSKDTTGRIMLYVVLALLPVSVVEIYQFGERALVLILVTIASCLVSEGLFETAFRKKNTLGDKSAVVTGLLLALNLPSTLPYWKAVLGGVVAIVILKMLFGGLGKNLINPAAGALCALLPLYASNLKSEPIGGASETAVLLGGLFLILMGVIDLTIPVVYMITFILVLLLFGGQGLEMSYLAAEFQGTGLLLGMFFLANDPVTSPNMPVGQILYGICLGILTALIRLLGLDAGNVALAIVLGNLMVPILEKITFPRAFGKK